MRLVDVDDANNANELSLDKGGKRYSHAYHGNTSHIHFAIF